MNGAQRREWLEAAAACLAMRAKKLALLLSRLDTLQEGGRWEAAFSALPRTDLLRLRYFGSGSEIERWREQAASIFSLGRASLGRKPPTAGLPWWSLDWDGGKDSLVEAGFYGRKSQQNEALFYGSGSEQRRVRFKEAPFSMKNFPQESLDRKFVDFHSLCPIRCLRLEWESKEGSWAARPRWSLILKKPLAWPFFLRTDLASAFSESSSQLSLLALDRKVSELAFEGDSLWAYFGA